MKATDDALFEKLRKLKALADEAQNESECQTALLMFQKLLKKNGLTAAAVEVREDAPDSLRRETTREGRRVETWVRRLNLVIARHFRCFSLYKREAGWTLISLYGHDDDVRIAASAFKAAYGAAIRLCDNYRLFCLENEALRIPCDKFDRNAYLIGFTEGLEAAYKRQEASGELGLMIVTPPDVVRAVAGFKRRNFTATVSDGDSLNAGYNDGFSVGQGNALT